MGDSSELVIVYLLLFVCLKQDMKAQSYKPSTKEAEEGRSLMFTDLLA